MKPRLWKIAAFLVLVGGVAIAGGACDTTDDDSCASVCATTPDCNGTSCLAYCIATRDACNATSNQSLFSAWASCQPTLICTGGEYVAASCDVEAIGLLECGSVASSPAQVGSSSGSGSGGIVFVTPTSGSGSATVSENSGESSSDDGDFDAGFDGGFDGGVDADVDAGF
jgi:hypothetical protein